MLVERIYDDGLAQAAYLIGCQATREAIVIDPQRDVDRYFRTAAAHGMRIVAVAETHIHADFLSGSRELAEAVGAKVYVSDEGGDDWKYGWLDQKVGGGAYPHQLLHDGDSFRIGHVRFDVRHTPGHTPEHICFLVRDGAIQNAEPMAIVSGDFVFVGDVGRPDLLESAAGQAGAMQPAARELYKSLRAFVTLPEYMQVWPGHGAGSACGKALGAVPTSTVGYEKRFNPSLLAAAASEDLFVRTILAGQPEPPLYFARMKRDNKQGPRVLGGLPDPRQLSPDELAKLDGRKIAIIDTRPWNEFRTGHVPGSLHIMLDGAFSTDAGSFINEQHAIHLIVEPAWLGEAVRRLVRVGLDNVVGWTPPQAVAEAAKAGCALATCDELEVGDAKSQVAENGWFVLDVRRANEYAMGRMETADSRNVAHTRLAAHLDDLPRDRPILVNCQGGVRSARACSLLKRNGFNVTNLAGGMRAWAASGGPVAR